VADDIHWADTETLHLLERLARTAPEGRTLVVAAFRDGGDDVRPELADALPDLSRLAGVTRVTAGNLGQEAVSAFIRASTDAEAPAELAAAISELTDGTPLLLCELWRELRESGAVEVAESRVRLSRPLAELRGPERVRDIVRQRLSRLAPAATALVELAAVAGPRFELRVLGEAGALDHGELVAAVDEAAGSGMIEELPEPVPACRFTHELVRRAVYDRIAGLRRAELHLRVGEALEQLYAADPGRVLLELAHHFTLAAPVAGAARAIDYNLRAGEAAIAAAAFVDAAARLSSALALGIDDPRERARTQMELGHVLNELGRHRESYEIMVESLDAATGLEERGLAAHVLVQRSSQRLFSEPGVDPEETMAVAKAAAATFEELGDARGLAVAGRLLALAFKRSGRDGDAYVECERALVHADASGHQATRRRVVATLVFALTEGPTPVADGINRCEQLDETHGDDPFLHALIARSYSALLAMAGRFDEAREHVDESSLVLDELRQLTASGVYRGIAAETRELIGDRAGAEAELRAQWLELRDARADGGPDGRAMHAGYQLACLYCDDGRWDAAADCLEYGRDVPEPDLPNHWVPLRFAASGRIAAHEGRLAEAVVHARRGVETAEQSDRLNNRARVWLSLAEVQRAAGAPAEADAAVAAALRLYDEKGNVAAARRLRAGATSAAP